MRRAALFATLALLTLASCAPLETEPTGLVDFEDVPAEWGRLVSVTKHDRTEYYELWFDNAETGSITHVPLYRPTWQIKIDRVRTLPRRDAAVLQGGAS